LRLAKSLLPLSFAPVLADLIGGKLRNQGNFLETNGVRQDAASATLSRWRRQT
jgi:hypothetical protein